MTQSPGSPAGVPSASESTAPQHPDPGATQKHSTKMGVFTWTLPADWTVTVLERSSDLMDFLGMPYEHVRFDNADETVRYEAVTGVGPTDNDGAKPDVVEVLDTEALPEAPESEEYPGEVWYRAAVLRGVEIPGEGDTQIEPGEYVLAVDVVTVPDGDPASTEDYWNAWTYVLPRLDGAEAAAANFFISTIRQCDAEQLTRLEGEEAVRAVLGTEEYAELRDVATSMDVRIP